MTEAQREYASTVSQIREVCRIVVPPESTIIVISKGDNQLLEMGGRRVWHFPQTAQGDYAGYYPADSHAAIEHLEELRGKGGDILVVPRTAFWWLDHYAQFKQHLEDRYERIVTAEFCLIYRLVAVNTAVAEPESPSDPAHVQNGPDVETVTARVTDAVEPEATGAVRTFD